MSDKKGFSLIEIIVITVIIGILSAISFTSYNTFVQQGGATAAQNNLITIYNAQKSFYLNNNGEYCTKSTKAITAACKASAGIACGNDIQEIDCNLSLPISTTTNYAYDCIAPTATTFTCTAISASAGVTLTLTNGPIVLPGGTGTQNPSCNGSPYCPT